MYMARIKNKNKDTYVIRESIPVGDTLGFKDLFNLGPSPGAWIDYPGGNAWYISPDLESAVSDAAANFDSDLLEDLFWPFLRPGIRRAVEAFRDRSAVAGGFKRLSRDEKEKSLRSVPDFDKRRAHFLKFGNMDQGPLVNMPALLFKSFQNKSRDEMEQWFMAQEAGLNPGDFKSYVYTVFDLQQFFQGFMAKQMPQALDQAKVEAFFIKEICDINKTLFNLTDHLHDYLVRYLIMFFYNPYGGTVLLEEMEQDFRFRHRSFNQQPKSSVSRAKAREVFNLSKSEFKAMDKKALTKRFRKLARAHHPDMGGSHEKFVEINEAYQALVERFK